MTWLSELVESSEDSLEALPVPCLCEFLLANQIQEGEQEGGMDETGPSTERLGHREKYRKKKPGRTKVGGAGAGEEVGGAGLEGRWAGWCWRARGEGRMWPGFVLLPLSPFINYSSLHSFSPSSPSS